TVGLPEPVGRYLTRAPPTALEHAEINGVGGEDDDRGRTDVGGRAPGGHDADRDGPRLPRAGRHRPARRSDSADRHTDTVTSVSAITRRRSWAARYGPCGSRRAVGSYGDAGPAVPSGTR